MKASLFKQVTCIRMGHKQRGVTAIEYAIIGVVVSFLVLAVFITDGQIQSAFSGAITKITSNISLSGN